LFLILIVVGIKGCLNARKERAIKDFGTNVASLVNESNQVGLAFFANGLEKASTTDYTEFSTQVKSYRSATASQYDRLKSLSTPSEMTTAKGSLLTEFAMRRNAMAVIADNIDQAFAKEGAIEAQQAISDQMKLLYGSDQVYEGAVLPEIDAVVQQQGITDFPAMPRPCTTTAASTTSSTSTSTSSSSSTDSPSTFPGTSSTSSGTSSTSSSSGSSSSSKPSATTVTPTTCSQQNASFIPAPEEDWLDQTKVTDALSGFNGAASSTPTTGTHGMQLLGVKIGDTALDPSTSVTVPAGNPVLNIEVQNSGDSEESGVTVTVNIGGSTTEGSVPRIGPGETQVVKIPLTNLPPSGEQTTIDVQIQPVPGEVSTDNNSATYTVTFQ
jgi:hypothetical protein